MADVMFNVGKGRLVELYKRIEDNDPPNSALVILLLKTSVADATLIDFADINAMLIDVGVVEADFTNYTRITFSDTELASLPIADNATDTYALPLPNAVWASAGGVLNNTLAKLILCFDYDTTTGVDADLVPIAAYDYTGTTDGSTLSLQFPTVAFSAA